MIFDKSIDKLIDVVSKGIGTLYTPRKVRKIADAKAYEVEVLAKAEAKKILIEGEAKIDLLERAKRRLIYEEIINQTNIEEIAEKSIELLNEGKPSTEEVDSNWRKRFFDKAKEISTLEIQNIWAKILATEVEKPNSISLRTLGVLANLTKNEILKFEILLSLVNKSNHIYKLNGENDFKNYGLNYQDIMMLREAGLVHPYDGLYLITDKSIRNIKKYCYLQIGDYWQKFALSKKSNLRLEIISLSVSGIELRKIIKIEQNENYTKSLYKYLEKVKEIKLFKKGSEPIYDIGDITVSKDSFLHNNMD